jgi:predicted nucleic-acid-binding protein
MIALDTNVIVRLLVNDDPAQTRRARALIEKRPSLGAKSSFHNQRSSVEQPLALR